MRGIVLDPLQEGLKWEFGDPEINRGGSAKLVSVGSVGADVGLEPEAGSREAATKVAEDALSTVGSLRQRRWVRAASETIILLLKPFADSSVVARRRFLCMTC